MRLKDKVAIVTGGGQGIGKGIVLRFFREGAQVAIADINLENARKVAQEIESEGGKALPLKVDVTRAEEVRKMVEEVEKKLGRIDILVNSAGVIKAKFITELEEEDWDRIINVDLKGTFLCSREVAKVMIKQKKGKIINISSKSGKKGGLWLSAYCAAKFGVIGLTQSVALDLAPYNINVNAVCPGNVFSTPMWQKQLFQEYAPKLGVSHPEEVRKIYVEKVPLGREATVEDIANVVVFLASEESNYMTGQAINVTGGQEMR